MNEKNGLNEKNREAGQYEEIEVINVSRKESGSGNIRRTSGAGNPGGTGNGRGGGKARRGPEESETFTGGGRPRMLERPENAGRPGQPGATGRPGNRKTPDPSGKPRMLERPEHAGRPGQPGATGRPGSRKTPDPSGRPRMLERPENAGRPGQPGATGRPGRPGQPGATGRPGRPGQPGATGRPGRPGQPGVTGRPGNPGQSGVTGRPERAVGSGNRRMAETDGMSSRPASGDGSGAAAGRNSQRRPSEREGPEREERRNSAGRGPEGGNPGRRNPEGSRREANRRNFDQRNLDRINAEKGYSRRNPGRRNQGRGRRGSGVGPAIALGLLALLIAVGAGGYFYVDSLAYSVCRAQAGSTVAASDFMKNGDPAAVFTEGGDSFDTARPGEYQVKVKSGFFTHKCTLIIEDTVAPTAQPVQVTIPIGTTCGPESFVSDIQDATEVTVSFASEPDFSQKGAQAVQIILTDRGNNRTIVNSELYLSIVAENVTVEAGQGIPGLDKFVAAGEEGQFITDMSEFDYTKVGDYPVALLVNGENYTSVMHVVDTVPPVVEVHDIEDFAFVPTTAADFVSRIEDVTEVTASYKKEPDLSFIGTQEVELVYTDAGNNRTEKTAKLTLKEDKEAPVIHGAADLVIYAGDTVSYKKDITVTDNAAKGLTLEVDVSQVNTRAEGIYPVTYVASDAAGNTSQVTINLTVKPRLYDIEEVNALGDSVLANLITADMTEMEKLEAIYTYIMGHISYINDSEKGDWVQAAYEGLMNRKGDCYVYASTAKLLLTRAGIKNMDIEKIPSNTLHYWNLVDIGDGWYHFDTTPRKDHPRIFMWDDQQMMDYSETHDKSHNYDHSLYPKVNGSTQESLPDGEQDTEEPDF